MIPKINVRHKGCGGEVYVDLAAPPTLTELSGGWEEKNYPVICKKCGANIFGSQHLERVSET